MRGHVGLGNLSAVDGATPRSDISPYDTDNVMNRSGLPLPPSMLSGLPRFDYPASFTDRLAATGGGNGVTSGPWEENDCFMNVMQANGTCIGYFVGNHPNPGTPGTGGNPHPNFELKPAGFGLKTEKVSDGHGGHIAADATLGNYEGAILIATATVLTFYSGGIVGAAGMFAGLMSPQEARDDFNAVYNDFMQFQNSMPAPYPHEGFVPGDDGSLSSAAEVIAPMAPGVDNGASVQINLGDLSQDVGMGTIGTGGNYGGGVPILERYEFSNTLTQYGGIGDTTTSTFILNSSLNT